MNSAPLKSALKYAGAWGVALTFIALLTIIFSFLGALFCAAVGGMMMGATKASKRLSLAFSALCPGVLIGILKTQRTELPQRQLTVLAVLCLAVFWVLYAISMFLIAYEKNEGSANTSAGDAHPPRTDAGHDSATEVPGESSALRLGDLEGRWCADQGLPHGRGPARVLEINSGTVALSTLDAHGRICTCARGRLEVRLTETDCRNDGNGVELAAGI